MESVMTVIHPPRQPLFEAARMLSWGVILLETETVFGIASTPKHIDRIFKIKSRDYSKVLSWVFPPKSDFVSSRYKAYKNETFDSCWDCSKDHKDFFDYLLEVQVPITAVFPGEPKLKTCHPPASSKMGIGVRFGNFGLNQLAHVAGPYLLTSANKSGQKPPKMIEEVDEEILSKVVGFYNLDDVIIDNDHHVYDDRDGDYFLQELEKYHKVLSGSPSPVIALSKSTIKTLRGEISKSFKEEVKKVFPKFKFE